MNTIPNQSMVALHEGRVGDGRLAISVEEAGAALGLSRASAYAAAKNGELPTVRIGRRLLVPVVGLQRLLAATSSRDHASSEC